MNHNLNTYSGVEQARGNQRADNENEDEGEETVRFCRCLRKWAADKVCGIIKRPGSWCVLDIDVILSHFTTINESPQARKVGGFLKRVAEALVHLSSTFVLEAPWKLQSLDSVRLLSSNFQMYVIFERTSIKTKNLTWNLFWGALGQPSLIDTGMNKMKS